MRIPEIPGQFQNKRAHYRGADRTCSRLFLRSAGRSELIPYLIPVVSRSVISLIGENPRFDRLI